MPFPSPGHQHTWRLHYLKVQREFLSCTSTCYTSLSAQGEMQPETHCRALNALNTSCHSGACISCFGFFPGGFDVNPFHTSKASVLLQAFFFFLIFSEHSYIYIWEGVDFGCHCAVSERRLYWCKTFHLTSLTHSSKHTRCCVWVTELLNLLPALSVQMAWMLGIIRGTTYVSGKNANVVCGFFCHLTGPTQVAEEKQHLSGPVRTILLLVA